MVSALQSINKNHQYEYQMGTYGYDLAFIRKHNIEVLELSSDDGLSKVMVIPAWQGRVMTTTSGGDEGTVTAG